MPCKFGVVYHIRRQEKRVINTISNKNLTIYSSFIGISVTCLSHYHEEDQKSTKYKVLVLPPKKKGGILLIRNMLHRNKLKEWRSEKVPYSELIYHKSSDSAHCIIKSITWRARRRMPFWRPLSWASEQLLLILTLESMVLKAIWFLWGSQTFVGEPS